MTHKLIASTAAVVNQVGVVTQGIGLPLIAIDLPALAEEEPPTPAPPVVDVLRTLSAPMLVQWNETGLTGQGVSTKYVNTGSGGPDFDLIRTLGNSTVRTRIASGRLATVYDGNASLSMGALKSVGTGGNVTVFTAFKLELFQENGWCGVLTTDPAPNIGLIAVDGIQLENLNNRVVAKINGRPTQGNTGFPLVNTPTIVCFRNAKGLGLISTFGGGIRANGGPQVSFVRPMAFQRIATCAVEINGNLVSGFSFVGEHYETLVFDGALSDAEIEIVAAAIAPKWGVVYS